MNENDINRLSLKAFAHIFNESINSDQRFCFILGAGTSKEAGILTGQEMANLWISEIKNKYEKNELKKLMKKFGLKNLQATSENYFAIYDLRFYPDYHQGQVFLQEELEKAVPCIGHRILSNILVDGKNNIAITTNFDSLIEEAIRKYTDKKPILIDHEALSQFVNINTSKPIVAKIHRGLYYEPLNRKEELNDLKDEWKEILKQIFSIYTPIVIGYAGGDQTLMKFLKNENLKLSGLYWCYWNQEQPSQEIKNLIYQKNGCLIAIDGFENMMKIISPKSDFNKPKQINKTVSIGTINTPTSITFFDIYGVKTVQELQIKKRWTENNASTSLSVPIGIGELRQCIKLNLHEQAHGPHCIVAGIAGYGKYEFIKSYILSLAINFHPHEVGIVLFDRKNSQMASRFEKLPHLLGVVASIDEEYTHFEESIFGELRRRQYILSAKGIHDIYSYRKLFRERKVKEPLPDLFLIYSELTDLNGNLCDFFNNIRTIIRVGRSCGIHVILATSTPTVITNEIWPSFKSKICFKLHDEENSYKILNRADARYIANIGQAYLQVDEQQICEKFQALWAEVSYKDMRQKTQLEDTIQHIIEIYNGEDTLQTRKIWFPPLRQMVISPYQNIANTNLKTLDTTLDIGIVDIPREQRQLKYKWNFLEKGHIVYMASKGYGKSVFLGNIILGLAIKNSVKNLKFFIIDMGNYALLPYKKLLHVEDYFSFRDIERINQLNKTINNIMKDRKELLNESKVENFTIYNQTQENKLSAIIIAVDNYEHAYEFGEDLILLLKKVALDGVDLGIYLAVTTSNLDTMGFSTRINFEGKIAGFNYKIGNIDNLIGHSHIQLREDQKGRALIQLDDNKINLIQLYSPVPCKDKNIYNNELLNLIDKINDACYKEARFSSLSKINKLM